MSDMPENEQQISESVDTLAEQIDVDDLEDEAARLGIPVGNLIDRLANELKMRVTGEAG